MKKTKDKRYKIAGITILFAILAISFASAANFWACFSKGQKINFCNPDVPDRTCGEDTCKVCMSKYDSTLNCYSSGNPIGCNLGGDCADILGRNDSFDLTPPKISIINPLNGSLSTNKKVLLSFSLDETAKEVYYLDVINGKGRWIKVCYNCKSGNPAYSSIRTFNEGQNKLLFKAKDYAGNEGYTMVDFLIDSIPPRIYKTTPTSGFADGTFEVEFKETNTKKVIFYYGTDSKEVPLSNCHEDTLGKTKCTINVQLNKYNGQSIEYYFKVEDIAGNTYISKARKVNVDTQPPVVNNPNSFYSVFGRYLIINMSISEKNFYKVTYIDNNDPKTIEKTICSSLIKGLCQKKLPLNKGNYSYSIQVKDKAGNSIALPVNFNIN